MRTNVGGNDILQVMYFSPLIVKKINFFKVCICVTQHVILHRCTIERFILFHAMFFQPPKDEERIVVVFSIGKDLL